MPYALIPTTKIRTKKAWKELGFTPGQEYNLWVHQGHGILLNDNSQPIILYRGHIRRIKRKKDFLWTFIKRRLK